MRTTDRHERQLSLEDLLMAGVRWAELPQETRAEVVEMIAQMLREHVAQTVRPEEATDE
jgi:hypothetical protein